MAVVVPTNGERITLEYLVNKSKPQNLVLRLFANDIQPIADDSVSRYLEARGYAPMELIGDNWTVLKAIPSSNGTAAVPTTASHAQQILTFTAPAGKIYGYYLTRLGTGDLVMAERFSNGPYEIKNSGDQIRLTPHISSAGRRS